MISIISRKIIPVLLCVIILISSGCSSPDPYESNSASVFEKSVREIIYDWEERGSGLIRTFDSYRCAKELDDLFLEYQKNIVDYSNSWIAAYYDCISTELKYVPNDDRDFYLASFPTSTISLSFIVHRDNYRNDVENILEDNYDRHKSTMLNYAVSDVMDYYYMMFESDIEECFDIISQYADYSSRIADYVPSSVGLQYPRYPDSSVRSEFLHKIINNEF